MSTRKVGTPDAPDAVAERRARLWADHDDEMARLPVALPWECKGCSSCKEGEDCQTCEVCIQARRSALASECMPTGGGPSRTEITEWSARSRSRMVERLASLDYTPLIEAGRPTAMVTLTLPGDWETVAPTGRDFKRLVERFKTRYYRAWGESICGIWKLEFQGRGAPHLHILMAPHLGEAGGKYAAGLPFRAWLSLTWADVVAHPDPEQRALHVKAGTGVDYGEGLRMTDPKRVAVYFTKHSAPGGAADKEYQHLVPEQWQRPGAGPGRFWGVWGLEVVERTVEVAPDEAIMAARILRRWSRAQGLTRRVRVWRPRLDLETGEVKAGWRRSTVRAVRMQGGRGFICLNDAPGMVSEIARYLDSQREQLHPERQRRRVGGAPPVTVTG